MLLQGKQGSHALAMFVALPFATNVAQICSFKKENLLLKSRWIAAEEKLLKPFLHNLRQMNLDIVILEMKATHSINYV